MPRAKKGSPVPTLNHYQALDVPPTATDADIKKAWKSLTLLHHPDKLTGLNLTDAQHATHKLKFQAAKDAYETLLDASKRKQYDLELAMKGVMLGDRLGNTEPMSKENEELFFGTGTSHSPRCDSDDEDEDGNSTHNYPQVYQSSVAGLSWDDGILVYQALGWNLQIQIDDSFADIVRGDLTPFDGSMDELQIFVDIKRAPHTHAKLDRREKAGKDVLSILITRTPKLRKVVRVESSHVWSDDGVESVYITIELAPVSTSASAKHAELKLSDLDLNCTVHLASETSGANCSSSRSSGSNNNGKSVEYHKLAYQKLKDMCRERSIQTSGTKAELVERLQEDDRGEKQKGRVKKVEGVRKGNSAFSMGVKREANLRMRGSGVGMGGKR
jgi:curved DNA-binding protein CbpA